MNSDGTIDKSFGDNGRALAPEEVNGVTAVVRQRDGGVLLAGRYFTSAKTTFGVIRFTASGRLDTNFGQAGVMYADVGNQPVPWAMALDAQGKALLAGSHDSGSVSDDFTLARFVPPPIVMRSTWLSMAMR